MIAAQIQELGLKVVSLNVLQNESMGVDGARAFSELLKVGGGGVLKSLCGIQPSMNTIEVPRKELNLVDAFVYAAELENSQWQDSIGNEQNQGRKVAKLMRRGRVEGHVWYPLIWAARDGNNVLVEAMLERGADIDQHETDKHDAGYTPLIVATIKGHPRTVELLLERGAATELFDNHKRTAAMHAEARGFAQIQTLLEYCARKARENKTHFANIIQRAAFFKTAVQNFKASLGTVNPEVDMTKVGGAVVAMQKIARGRTERNLLKGIEKQVEEALPSKVQSLAKRAVITQVAASKLKAAVVPMHSKLAKAAEAERKVAARDAELAAIAEAEAAAEAAVEAAAAAEAAAAVPEMSKAKSQETLASAPMAKPPTPRSKTGSKDQFSSQAKAATNIQRLARGKSGRIVVATKKGSALAAATKPDTTKPGASPAEPPAKPAAAVEPAEAAAAVPTPEKQPTEPEKQPTVAAETPAAS